LTTYREQTQKKNIHHCKINTFFSSAQNLKTTFPKKKKQNIFDEHILYYKMFIYDVTYIISDGKYVQRLFDVYMYTNVIIYHFVLILIFLKIGSKLQNYKNYRANNLRWVSFNSSKRCQEIIIHIKKSCGL